MRRRPCVDDRSSMIATKDVLESRPLCFAMMIGTVQFGMEMKRKLMIPFDTAQKICQAACSDTVQFRSGEARHSSTQFRKPNLRHNLTWFSFCHNLTRQCLAWAPKSGSAHDTISKRHSFLMARIWPGKPKPQPKQETQQQPPATASATASTATNSGHSHSCTDELTRRPPT